MQDLQSLEIFEIEVLELMNSVKILDQLYFGGGTMLRLCHNLNRYSTDLDFWIDTALNPKTLFAQIKEMLSYSYRIVDHENKKYTLLFEIKSNNYKRSLKIEIRKEQTNFDWERKIAFSKFTNKQVTVKGLTLKQMMKNKIEALLSRKIIRDCYDIEFLLMRGEKLPDDKSTLVSIKKIIESFTERDYRVVLGSILEEKERRFYLENRFKLLKEEINRKLIAG